MRPSIVRGIGRAAVAATMAFGALVAGNGAATADAAAPNAAMQALYAKAKAEGTVSVWAPVTREVDWIPAEFAKRYPGIKVETVGNLQGSIKIISAARAGRQIADTWITSIGDMLPVAGRGLLAKTDWTPSGTAKDNVFLDGSAAAFHNFVYCVLYAKGKVGEADLPKTWEDLLDPKWKGKLVASDFLLPRLMGYFGLLWGPEKAEKWGRALINDQKILITNAPIQNFLRSGERVLDVGGAVDQAVAFTEDGVPSAYHLMQPTAAGQFAIATLKNAPHPAAAALLANWLASTEGKRAVFDKIHAPDIRPGSDQPVAKEIQAQGIKVVYEDASTVEQRATFYKQFSPLVRGQ